jgi:AraC family transcriptional regulator, dual regulator of chb operon
MAERLDQNTKICADGRLNAIAQARYVSHNERTARLIGFHTHDFFEIFLVTEGEVVHRVGEDQYIIGVGGLAFIRPDDYHCVRAAPGRQCRYVNLEFSRQSLEALVAYLGPGYDTGYLLKSPLPPVRMLDPIEFETLKSKLAALDAISADSTWARHASLRLILADVCCRLLAPSMLPRSDIPLWLARLQAAMEQPENFSQGIARLLALSNRSREHVCRSFKRLLHVSPSEFVNQRKINYAASLLRHTDKTIKEIVDESGFRHIGYFGRVFKKIMGQSPSEYRRGSIELNE